MAVSISGPLEDNAVISRYSHLALALQQIEEDKVHNMEKKEHIIMRDGDFATMMQQQEEEEAQKLMDTEQRAMTSTPIGRSLLLVQSVLSLNHFLKSSVPQNLGVT